MHFTNEVSELEPQHQWKWSRFFYGGCGAAAVEVLRVYKILTANGGHYSFSYPYLIVSACLIVLGGVFATAWGDDKPIKCLYTGATFPFWLSGWAYHQ
jgi:hypothetical protein